MHKICTLFTLITLFAGNLIAAPTDHPAAPQQKQWQQKHNQQSNHKPHQAQKEHQQNYIQVENLQDQQVRNNHQPKVKKTRNAYRRYVATY